MILLLSAGFFQNKLFHNSSSGTLSESISLDSDQFQAVCKHYQQMTVAATSKERVKQSYTYLKIKTSEF